MAEPEKETDSEPEKPKSKKAKTDAPPAEAQKTEATPADQDGAPAVSEHPSAKAQPAVKRAKKPAKSKKEEPAPAAAAPRENLSLSTDEIEKPKVVKAKGSKNIHTGIAHVLSTFNNTIVTITDMNGNVIGWSSAAKVGFKGSRKSTAYAAQM